MANFRFCISKFVAVLTVLFCCSCSEPNDDAPKVAVASKPSKDVISPKCKVVDFSIVNMYFDEFKSFPVTFSLDFTERIGLNYTDNRITQVQGGLYPYPPGGSVSGFFWTNDLVQEVVYSGNTITVNSPGMYSKQFILVGNKIQSQNTTYFSSVSYDNVMDYSSGLHQYQYVGNVIIETKGDQIRRKFYMENGNLVKVTLFSRNFSGDILKKTDYLFSDYDNAPNLLKGKFFINGLFFKAFSKNNYRKLEMNTYNYVDGDYVLDTSQYALFTYTFNPENLFTQDCN